VPAGTSPANLSAVRETETHNPNTTNRKSPRRRFFGRMEYMNKWHRINFKIKWDRKSPAKFYIDLIIIDLLINPAVKRI